MEMLPRCKWMKSWLELFWSFRVCDGVRVRNPWFQNSAGSNILPDYTDGTALKWAHYYRRDRTETLLTMNGTAPGPHSNAPDYAGSCSNTPDYGQARTKNAHWNAHSSIPGPKKKLMFQLQFCRCLLVSGSIEYSNRCAVPKSKTQLLANLFVKIAWQSLSAPSVCCLVSFHVFFQKNARAYIFPKVQVYYTFSS